MILKNKKYCQRWYRVLNKKSLKKMNIIAKLRRSYSVTFFLSSTKIPTMAKPCPNVLMNSCEDTPAKTTLHSRTCTTTINKNSLKRSNGCSIKAPNSPNSMTLHSSLGTKATASPSPTTCYLPPNHISKFKEATPRRFHL